MTRALSVADEVWPLARPFEISRGAKTEAEVVVAQIQESENIGRGECVPYARYGEAVDGVVQQINDQNTSINENKIEVEKQLQEAINQQKKDNEQTLEALRKEMKAAANSAAADLEAVRAERAQLTQTIAEKLKDQKKTEELTPMQKKIRDAPAIAKIIAVKEDL